MIRQRLVLPLLGVALAVVAIIRDDRRVAWVAIAVLSVAIVLRTRDRWRARRAGRAAAANRDTP